MSDSEFSAISDNLFQYITRTLDVSGADLDFVQTDSGCFEIEAGGAGKIVINRHEVSREIWVAARSGARHFRWDGKEWRDTRSSETIWKALSEFIQSEAGVAISFDQEF